MLVPQRYKHVTPFYLVEHDILLEWKQRISVMKLFGLMFLFIKLFDVIC